jgi:hypothetical protein
MRDLGEGDHTGIRFFIEYLCGTAKTGTTGADQHHVTADC